ncbi:aspartate aminotransferase family protein [Nocardia sp. NPDC059246]|uniref:aminotransferase family protein n=1 Tax=unclassified Nocardia TaxID=2637762 RepID=UPI0036887CB8
MNTNTPISLATTTTEAEPARTHSALWHPFSDMAAVCGNEFVVDRADGVWIYDQTGRRYLDSTSSLWCVNVGHGRTEIRSAIHRQLAQLDSFSIFGDYSNQPAMDLADRIATLAPIDDAKVLFGSGGGDGIDTAARLSRHHFHALGLPGKTHIISRSGSYHGTHGWGITLAGIDANRAGNGPLIPDATQIPQDDADALEIEIQRIGPDRVAAFFCEPLVGSGGVYAPSEDYLKRVAEICRRYGVLLVIDSVICGFGRLGTWFGIEKWNIRPDMIVFAKGVSNGTLPLGGVVISGAVAAPFWNTRGNVFRHGATYSGHPVCCAAALATLDLLDQSNLLAQGRILEKPLADRLSTLAGHPAVAEVRAGTGLIGGIELNPDLLATTPGAIGAAFKAAREAGVLLRPLITSLAVSPPLTITEIELDIMVEGIRAALDTLTQ